jgi:hypothetical protein
MPVQATEAQLAASIGHDVKRELARRAVALDFFTEHVFEADKVKDWSVVQRALQCIDLGKPVLVGPDPPAPRRLVALPPTGPLGAGFFAEAPGKDEPAGWWVIAPEAVYLKYFAPTVRGDARARANPPARWFIPGVRTPRGPRVATQERG